MNAMVFKLHIAHLSFDFFHVECLKIKLCKFYELNTKKMMFVRVHVCVFIFDLPFWWIL